MATQASIIASAYTQRKPVAQAAAEMQGGGLWRSGDMSGQRGGFNPAVLAPFIPALTKLGEQAIPDIYSGIKSGIGKVGTWFKRLFSGGMRDPGYSHPDAAYHQMSLYKGPQKAEDFLPYMAIEPYRQKDIKRLKQIKGGFSESDIPRIMSMINTDPTFAKKLDRAGRKGNKTKFMNRIYRGLNKKKA